MASREASCSCGNLRVTCEGDPKYVLACHCLDCQRRTGSVFGVSAYFRQAQVAPSGADKIFVRDGQEGRKLQIHFCPECGTSIYWTLDIRPGFVGVAAGAFADPDFPAPAHSFWEQSRHPWINFAQQPARHDRQPG